MSPARLRYSIASRDRPLDLARRAHQRVAAERHRVLAGFAEHLEQPLALVAGREQPAIFDAEHADRNAAFLDQVEHLRVAHAGIEAALEIGAAQFDRVVAGLFGRIERGRERRRVDRPHMQGETPELFRHCCISAFILQDIEPGIGVGEIHQAVRIDKDVAGLDDLVPGSAGWSTICSGGGGTK